MTRPTRRIPGAGGPGPSNIVDATSTTENRNTDNSVHEFFEQILGVPSPVGCESCNAAQTAAARRPGAYLLIVHHDGCGQFCPVLDLTRSCAVEAGHR